MSTRVQKGGQKFKPVVKPRGRPGETPSRHTSAAPDALSTQVSRSLASTPRPTSRPPNSTSLHTVPEEADGPGETEQLEANSSSTNDFLPSGLLGGTGVFVTKPTVAQNIPWTISAQDEMQRSTVQGRPPLGTSRATPVVISARPVERPSQRPAVPIVLQNRTSTPIIARSSESGDVIISQARSDSTFVNTSEVGTATQNTFVALSEATTSTADAPATSIESINPKGNRRRRSTSSRAPSSTPVEGDRHRKRKNSATKATTAIDSQSQAESRNPEQSSRRRAKRRRSSAPESSEAHTEDDTEGEPNGESDRSSRPPKRRRSATVSSLRGGGRRRAPSLPPFDPDADPGEELDPTVVTMATICMDTGQGRVSSKAATILSNHAAWKAESKAKRARLKALMEAKKYGRKEDELDGEAAETTEVNGEEVPAPGPRVEGDEVILEAGDDQEEADGGGGFNYGESMSTNRFSAQVRIGPNGETIIDEESLFVDRVDGEEDVTEQYTHVEESDQTKFVNSASYSRKTRGSRWSAEETELFFDALSQFGENYELISYVLPGRDRKACKNKFKSEDKKNPNRITFCLNNRVPYDMQTLSRMTGKDFSGPTPEIRAPEIPTYSPAPELTNEAPTTDRPAKPVRKKSRTTAASDGVEILGDVETFDLDVDE